jgi:N-acyl-phosphatidylethanolamine-hydrolysing phospholipase D
VALLLLPLASVAARGGQFELPPAPRLHGAFRNLDPDVRQASNWARFRFYALGLHGILNGENVASLPTAVPDVDGLRTNRYAASVTWVGHSTLLVQLDGVNFLTDPTWSRRGGPFSGSVGVRRYTPPGIAFEDLLRSTSS